MIFSARQHNMHSVLYAAARPSIRQSLCHNGWISRNRLKLGSCNFHHRVAQSLQFLSYKFTPEILTGSPDRGRQTRVGWGKQALCVSKTAQGRTTITTND